MEEDNRKEVMSLKESIALLAENQVMFNDLMIKKKAKGFKLPWKAKVGTRKKKQNYCVIMYIGPNKHTTFLKAPIDENVIEVNGVPHVVMPEDILIYKNKTPLIIQPSWSERPFNANQHFRDTIEKNEGTMGWQYIVNYIHKSQLKEKRKIATGMIIVGVLVLAGLGYYLYKSGAFHA